MAESTRLQREFTCREVVELVSEYVEGTMTPEQMTAFELHLNFCDGCFTFLEQVRTTSAIARVMPEEQVPEDMKAALLDAFRDWRRE